MKVIATSVLSLALVGFAVLSAAGQDTKAPKLSGKYTLVAGKVNGNAASEESKKGEYTFAADKITIKSMDLTFVMGYKIDPKTKPMNVDMEILEGPEGTKGTKAEGIIEVKDGVVKLAYSIEKGKRPKDFKGESDFMFEFKKSK
jgi:uncharacterized protein (TIGR03067 family)